eukprot:TRINITY_DN20601_c0_g1_i1.p1 TRINITY_DN20601_c0_g1~~TRINITY_DN20601_c0_g1_i1.p1  ORF type:complete len:605 (+),score=133.17 TRINITY_DN20601_c0_g1_i1:148-1962(+)
MHLHAVDQLSGREAVIEVGADTPLSDVKQQCGVALGIGPDVDLSVCGSLIPCGSDPLSSRPGISNGCTVHVRRGVHRYVKLLSTGQITLDTIPDWARHRRECVLAALTYSANRWWCPLHWVSPAFSRDSEVMSAAVLTNRDHIFRVNPALRDDRSIVYASLMMSSAWGFEASLLRAGSSSAHTDKDALIRLVKTFPGCLEYASPALRADRDVVLSALSSGVATQLILLCIDRALLDDREVARAALPYCQGSVWLGDKAFVMEALPEHPEIFQHAMEGLRGDRDVAALAISASAQNYQHASPEVQGDSSIGGANEELRSGKTLRECTKEKLMDMFQSMPHCARFASRELRGDKEFVLAALQHTSLGFISKELLDDPEVARAGVRWACIQGSECLADKAFVLSALRINPDIFQLVHPTLRGDKAVVMKAIAASPRNFALASPGMQASKDVALAVANSDNLCMTLQFLEGLWGSDKAVSLAAVRRDTRNLMYVSAALRNDLEIAHTVVTQDPGTFCWLGELPRDNVEVAIPAILKNQRNFFFAGERVRANREAIRAAFKYPTREVLLPFVDPELQKDGRVAFSAITSNPENYAYSPMLQKNAGIVAW